MNWGRIGMGALHTFALWGRLRAASECEPDCSLVFWKEAKWERGRPCCPTCGKVAQLIPGGDGFPDVYSHKPADDQGKES
jgi:hypothetical protein